MNLDYASILNWITEQLATLEVMLSRQVVQRQLLTIIIVLLVAWLIPRLIGLVLTRLEPEPPSPESMTLDMVRDLGFVVSTGEERKAGKWRERILRWLRALDYVLFPLLALIAFQMISDQLQAEGLPYGLIESITPLLLLFLAYRLVNGVALALMHKEKAERFTRRFVRPLLIVLLLWIAARILFDTLTITDTPLLQVQGVNLTVGRLLYATMALIGFYALSWGVYEIAQRIMRRGMAEVGVTQTVSNIARYTVIALGVLTALSILGVDLATLGWIGTGLSVGIGFGLQELFGNFVSGVLLSFERSVRPGDVIETGGQRGTVTSVGMRSTVIRTSDNIEVFVPNKELLTKQMLAYTYTDRSTRVKISVGVAYGSDLDKVAQLLLGILKQNAAVLEDPAPGVNVSELGVYSVVFQMSGNVAEYRDAWAVRTELLRCVYDTLSTNGIVMPYPRQDVQLVGGTQ